MWMKDQLKTSNRATLKDILNATSSLASESGLTLSDEQGGLTTEPSGPVAVPANLSPRQAKERGLLTSDTSGRLSSISSESAVLGQCLANRLQAKTALVGSTLFKLIWKQRSTPAGRSICALRASVLRTSGKDSTGWPSPKTTDSHGSKAHGTGGQGLHTVDQMSGWPTPMAGTKATETYNEAGNTD